MFGSHALPLWQQLDYSYCEQLFAAMIRWGNNSNHTRLFLVSLTFFWLKTFICSSPTHALLISLISGLNHLQLFWSEVCFDGGLSPAAQATSPAVQGIVLQKQGAKVCTLPLFSCRNMKSNSVFILWFGYCFWEVLHEFLLPPHSAGLNFPSFLCSAVIHFSVIPLTLFQIQETRTQWCIHNAFILYSTHVAWRIKKLKYYSWTRSLKILLKASLFIVCFLYKEKMLDNQIFFIKVTHCAMHDPMIPRRTY